MAGLSEDDAEDIVVNCILELTGVQALDLNKKLGIPMRGMEDNLLELFDLIVGGPPNGVKTKSYSLDQHWLIGNVQMNTIVFDIVEIVWKQSLPVDAHPFEHLASSIASIVVHLNDQKKMSRKKGRKPRGRR